MVAEQRQPSLHWVRISRGSADPSRDTPFREIETQREQFAMNARRSPGWILSHHTEDQGAILFADTLPSSYLADSGDPRPIRTKSRSMPVHDGSRSDQDERITKTGRAHYQRTHTMRKINALTSVLTRFCPPTWRILETHVQYERNPARCQFTTVLGVTKTRGCLHLDQHILNATQNSLCRAVQRRRGRCACSASNCRRRAMFSRTRSARQLSQLTNQPRKCRSDTIMARILAEKTESSCTPSH